ncbi:dynamin family protein [Cellulomonas wangsupingiae]|uniref:Dynamin family protein n=1 Tax=Cellulomonas wangsupingiae TaxID=2968085 RepID=A0ABY5KBA9_9CELL|nr:dynamin family protein [Cellulomonas wangsupingiae]MCC2334622.1 dynamin family protein [Cellulomonas wangsupingiae]MCM0638658.1 dynamin family protein [Cellulomonas wangsupingiae]UUI66412.1 dynamin family protein [Cellulomonas wangsupingiae]
MSAQPGTVPAQPSASAQGDLDTSTATPILARPLAQTSLLDAVRDLRRDVEATSFPLEIPGVDEARGSRARLVDQLDEHLVPRLTELSAPAVVVVAGSTGAGKSTLVNSLVGREVSAAGVLRPTTREPVLVHHPLDADLLSHHPVLDEVEAVAADTVPRGIAILDAPDLDSVLESNRDTAHRLLEAADLWLFVTTAARYGDALPWHVLESAVERSTSVAMVLNRVPPASLPTVRGDLLDRLRTHGLAGSPLFVIPDLGPHTGPLSAGVVAPVLRWLTMLAGPDRARTVVARTLRGALAALRPWVDELAEAVQDQADAAARVAQVLDEAVVEPGEAAADTMRSGAVADGAVRARWAELVANGAPLSRLVGRSGRVRGSSRTARSRAAAVAPMVADLNDSTTAVLTAVGQRGGAALRTSLTGPTAPPGGPSVLARWPDGDASRVAAAERAARAWTGEGTRTVRAALAAGGTDPRRTARVARAVGEDALAAVALAAAAGVDEAAETVRTLLGAAGDDVVTALREDLVRRARAQVQLERTIADRTLDDPDLAADASSRLRLRLAVLKGLT